MTEFDDMEERAKIVLIGMGKAVLYLLPGVIILIVFGVSWNLFQNTFVFWLAFLLLSSLVSAPAWIVILLVGSLPAYVITGKSLPELMFEKD